MSPEMQDGFKDSDEFSMKLPYYFTTILIGWEVGKVRVETDGDSKDCLINTECIVCTLEMQKEPGSAPMYMLEVWAAIQTGMHACSVSMQP